MKYKNFVRLYSNSRIYKYYKAVGKDKAKAMALYFGNQKISRAFYPLLGSVEVILRNQLHYTLAKHFNDARWIINQKQGFMVHSLLTVTDRRTGKSKTNHYLLKSVEDAEAKLGKKNVHLTPGRIIAEQTFGFWTSLYDIIHYKVLKGTPGTIFKNMPTGYGRKEIFSTLVAIRELRNRISHHEPICFVNQKCDFSYVKDMHQTIMNFLSWINPTIPSQLSEVDKVLSSIAKEEKKQQT